MKKQIIYLLILAFGMLGTAALLSGCGETGLDVAYKDLKEQFQTRDFSKDQSDSKNPVEKADTNITQFTYDKKNDTLQITLDFEKVKTDEFFEVLNDDIEDADVGNIQFLSVGTRGYTYTRKVYTPSSSGFSTSGGSSKDDDYLAYMKKFSKELGKLKCSSIKCLDVSGIINGMESSSWTKILKKTDALYVDQSNLNAYSTDEKAAKNLAKVKKLKIANSGTYFDLKGIESFSSVEEVSVSAGLTGAAKKENKSSGLVLTDSFSGYSATTNSGLDLLKKLGKLKSVLFFPELKTWEPNNKYYSALLALQVIIPDKTTNLWQDSSSDSSENKDSSKDSGKTQSENPVAFRDIDVMAQAGNGNDVTIQNTLRSVLKEASKNSYKTGRSYKKSKSSPKISGKCLVYIAYPSSFSTERKKQWNKERFYTYNEKVLLSELKSAGIQSPGGAYDYDTFVYVYPRFTKYGTYDKGTIGYTTKTNVRVYDTRKKVVYKSKEIDSEAPPNRFTYYGTPPEVRYPDMSTSKITKYLKKIKK